MPRKALLLKPLGLAAFRAAVPSRTAPRLTGPSSRSLPPTVAGTASSWSSVELSEGST